MFKFLSAILVTLLVTPVLACIPPGVEINGMADAAATVEQETGVPVAVPTVLPGADESLPVYATVLTSKKAEYEINLGYTPGCGGGTACSYGNLAGKQVTPNMIGTANFPEDLKAAKVVNLAGGTTGYFVESQCGANCSDAKVFWVENGYQYMVGIKAGREADVIDMANSAISDQLEPAP